MVLSQPGIPRVRPVTSGGGHSFCFRLTDLREEVGRVLLMIF
jgi:hypothetical protein